MVQCAFFTVTYENKKRQRGAFLLSTLPHHLAELSKVFQAVCFNLAQMKASVELCISKLSNAADKSELIANCEKFDSEVWELRLVWLSRVCQVSWRFEGHRKIGSNSSSAYTTRETGANAPTTEVSLLSLPGK